MVSKVILHATVFGYTAIALNSKSFSRKLSDLNLVNGGKIFKGPSYLTYFTYAAFYT